ncbi:MAG: flagellar hook-length control protein FliK [Eubacterium sp.]|nr:flagellar hook-length control protein FliK [Eubacterium sp.]
MVSSAISGISQKGVSAVSSISGRQNSQDSFGTDFSKVMNASLQNRNSGKTDSFEVSGNTAKGTAVVKQDNNVAKQDKTTVMNNSDTTTVNDDNLKEDVAQAVSDIKDKIKETMDVSDEDIENAMEQLGIGIVDLLDPQSVTDLVIALSGNIDSLEFLTDASAVANLEDIINTVDEVTQNLTETYNIDITSVKDIVKDFENDSDKAVASEQPVNKQITDYQDDKQNEKAVTEDTKESITDVIAEKTEVKSEAAFTDEKKNDSDTHLQDKSNDGIEKITSDMTQSIQKAFSEVVDETSAVNEVDIVRQVVEQIKVTTTQQLSSIEVMLNPENLGKVHVAVIAKQGIVTAQLTAQNEQVKAALENQMTALKEHFNNQGVKVESVEITVQSHGFESQQNLEGNNSEQAGQEKKTHRKLDLSSLEELEESDMTDEEIRAKDAIVNGNSSVEYSA